jgi:hypothetical protein
MSATTESRIRRWLLLLAAFIFLGTVGELILEEHTKETIQYLPFVLCIAGFITVVAVLLRPVRASLLALRITMVLTAAGGALGLVVHVVNNFEFEQEIQPNLAASDLLVATLKGANPLLAPGILAFAAIIALIATYYHPALKRRDIP